MGFFHWIIIPFTVAPLVICFLIALQPYMKGRKGSRAYDPKTGIGRGAPGFQTNVRRVAVTPELAARIRAGEQVSAEEVTAAQEEMARRQASGQGTGASSGSSVGKSPGTPTKQENEWLPQSSSGAGKRRGKK